MNYKVVFVLNAIVAIAFGVAFLFVPNTSLDFFGVDKYEATLLMTQFFGTELVAVGLLLWFAKNATDASLQRQLGWAQFISLFLGLAVNVIGVSKGVIRVNGWITILVYVILALLYGFMLFLKPRMKE